MAVGIDQARHHHLARRIIDLGILGDDDLLAHGDDAPALDQDSPWVKGTLSDGQYTSI